MIDFTALGMLTRYQSREYKKCPSFRENYIIPDNPDSPVSSTRYGGLVVQPTVAEAAGEGSIRIPQVDNSLGAGFGEGITDDNRRFVADCEHVAGFLFYGVAQDVVEKWFKVNDPGTSEVDTEFDKAVQKVLSGLKFKMSCSS